MLTAQQVLDYLLELQKTYDLNTISVVIPDWGQDGDSRPSIISLDCSENKLVIE